MNCSLNCFCDFYQAPTTEKKESVVRRYKKPKSGEAKGRSNYYTPVLNAIKDRLCTGGSVEEKIAAIAKACVNPSWTDKLNQIRIESNVQLYHAFRSTFGTKLLKIFACPRMQFRASNDVSVNVQPDLFFELDGQKTMLKLGVSKRKRPEHVIRFILQMLHRGTKGKGISVSIEKIIFLDARAGKTYVESTSNQSLEEDLSPVCCLLAEKWNQSS
jgi:hypothetical protein